MNSSSPTSEQPLAYIYGMSPGDVKEHIPEAVPVDAAVYIAHAREIRGTTPGVLYQDDQPYRWAREAQYPGRRELVEWRTRIIECIASKVDPGLRVVRDSQLVADGHMQSLDEAEAAIIRKKYANKQEGRYNVYQRETLIALRNLLGLEWNQIAKYGWYAERDINMHTGDDEYRGGEVDHDRAAPEELQRVYVHPGYELYRRRMHRDGVSKIYPARIGVPYLYARPEGDPVQADDRVILDGCLRDPHGVASQIARIKPGATKVALAQIEAASLAILQKPTTDHLTELRTHAPNWREDEVQSNGEIRRIHDLLEAAILELRRCLS